MKILNKNSEEIEGSAPRLDTVLMVEEFIEKNSGEYNQIELFRNIPKIKMEQLLGFGILYLLKNTLTERI